MARMPTRDLRQLIRLHLTTDATVKALVDARVFGRSLQDAEAGTVLAEGPLVIFEFLSGDALSSGQVAHQTLEVYGYSKRSLDEAAKVYDAVFESLQMSRLANTSIDMCGLAREVQRPVDGFNQDLTAWFVKGRWNVSATSGR
jgi:hypothetical protein